MESINHPADLFSRPMWEAEKETFHTKAFCGVDAEFMLAFP